MSVEASDRGEDHGPGEKEELRLLAELCLDQLSHRLEPCVDAAESDLHLVAQFGDVAAQLGYVVPSAINDANELAVTPPYNSFI